MSHMPTTRLREIADLVAPHVVDAPHFEFHRTHIHRITGLLKHHHPYLLRFDVASDTVGGVWFSTEVQAYYGLLDMRSEFMSSRLTDLGDKTLIQQAQHLVKVLTSEIQLNQGVPDQAEPAGIEEWLKAHTHTSEAQVYEFLDTYGLPRKKV